MREQTAPIGLTSGCLRGYTGLLKRGWQLIAVVIAPELGIAAARHSLHPGGTNREDDLAVDVASTGPDAVRRAGEPG